ncbi:MAG: hypothetical protein AAFX08_12425 [Pseudomonadota bacterium]
MRRALPTALFAPALVACGGTDTCVRKAVEDPGPREVAEIEAACAADPEAGLTLKFIPDPESEGASCEFLTVVTAPADFATPRISVNFILDQTTGAGTSFALSDAFFEDRLSGAYFSRDPWGDRGPCAETEIAIDSVTCRVSVEAGVEPQDCGPVTFDDGGLFQSFTTPG